MTEDGGYVHDPSRFETGGESADRDGDVDGEAADGDESEEPSGDPDAETATVASPDRADREFGARGWILVGVIAFAFLGCPLAIVLWPPGYSYLFALLILPLAPAVLLALTAVWATTRP